MVVTNFLINNDISPALKTYVLKNTRNRIIKARTNATSCTLKNIVNLMKCKKQEQIQGKTPEEVQKLQREYIFWFFVAC